MIDDQRFEIERAFDLLPHVVGASWHRSRHRRRVQERTGGAL